MLKLYLSHHCFLCRWLEPPARLAAAIFGTRLLVFKLHPDGLARQVNGTATEDAAWLPGVPALVAGRYVLVGLPLPTWPRRRRP